MDARTTSALLYLDAVSVSFDGFKALNDLSLTVEPGEMRAIIGPNGAGKTTMMDVVTGKTRPAGGDVLFDGVHDLTRLDEAEIATLGIGRKFQKPTVFDSHTVEDNLRLAIKADRRVQATLFWEESESERETAVRCPGAAKTRMRAVTPGFVQPSSVRPNVSQSVRHGRSASTRRTLYCSARTVPLMRKRDSFELCATNRVGETFAAPLRSSKRRWSFGNVLGVPSNSPG